MSEWSATKSVNCRHSGEGSFTVSGSDAPPMRSGALELNYCLAKVVGAQR